MRMCWKLVVDAWVVASGFSLYSSPGGGGGWVGSASLLVRIWEEPLRKQAKKVSIVCSVAVVLCGTSEK